VSTLAAETTVDAIAGLPPAEALDRALRAASPANVIEAALRTLGRQHLALVSSFGTESAALLKVMADVDPAIPVIFLDTGWLFEETLAYRDTLIDVLGLRDVRSIKPLEETLQREDPERELWFSDPDACCRIRKVEPLARALKPFSAWINGRQCLPRGDRGDLQACKAAAASAGQLRLPLGRLHALHQPQRGGRGRPRRTLARPRQDRMRHPYDQNFVG
jgi:phosphoadenosine phosphosulfate reductase